MPVRRGRAEEVQERRFVERLFEGCAGVEDRDGAVGKEVGFVLQAPLGFLLQTLGSCKTLPVL